VRRGDRVLLRLVGAGQFTRPMHLHGPDFRIVAKDGHPVSDPQAADVVQVASGERYDIAFTATEPGRWVFHCHIGHHVTSNGGTPAACSSSWTWAARALRRRFPPRPTRSQERWRARRAWEATAKALLHASVTRRA